MGNGKGLPFTKGNSCRAVPFLFVVVGSRRLSFLDRAPVVEAVDRCIAFRCWLVVIQSWTPVVEGITSNLRERFVRM